MKHELAYLKRPDGVTIAYGTAGSGPPLVLVPGWSTHLEWFFREPATLLFEPLTRHLTLITYDKHGCGLSDRDRVDFTLEAERLDLEAVVDHLGLNHFNLMGMSEGGPVAISYAAAFPERVDRLALYSTFAYGPSVASEDFQRSVVAIIRASWGVGSKVITDMLMPNASTEDQEEFAAFQRQSATPEVAASMMEMLYSWDVRPELPDVTAPTVIIHRRLSRAFPPRHGRDLAAGIANSRSVIVDGVAHFPPTPGDPHTIEVANELLGFLADGACVVPVREQGTFRTVVFTDVESSTELTDRFGDDKARDLLRRHEALCREAVAAHSGTEVKTMGDGFMLSFSSASGALDAAVAIQQAIAEHFADTETPIRVRVGINAGEPIEEEDDLHGAAVIQAARIMGAADGGQILVSGLVRELVAGKDYPFMFRGQRELKGFEEPVRLFELDWQGGGPMSNAAVARSVMEERVGAEQGAGEWFTVTQERIDRFADVTEDHQFIHIDSERAAAETPFGGTIAHGFLTLSLLTHLIDSIPSDSLPTEGIQMLINYGFDRVRFITPVPSGSNVRASAVVSNVELKGTAINVTQTVTVAIEGVERPALVAEWITRAVYDS